MNFSGLKDTAFYTKKTLTLQGNLVDLTYPKIMGILNITNDSFFDGGKFIDEISISKQAERLINEGADFIDIGAYSSRPGALNIDEKTELNRVLLGLKTIQKLGFTIPVSIDTFRSKVAETALSHGAAMINDISGGSMDPNMVQVLSKFKVPFIIMHMVGTPQNMMYNTEYTDIVSECTDYFAKKLEKFTQLGLKDVIIDIGFGFSKTLEQNYLLMEKLNYFRILNQPLMVGISRKSMIYKALKTTPEEALNGTTVLHTAAVLNGADILRVHDVAKTKEVLTLLNHLGQ